MTETAREDTRADALLPSGVHFSEIAVPRWPHGHHRAHGLT